MRFLSYGISAAGNVRRNNEDNYYINGHIRKRKDSNYEAKNSISVSKGLYAVCDGMGGHSNGDVASFICVRVLQEYSTLHISEHIHDYIETANRLICEYIERCEGIKSGATLALLLVDNNKAVSCNIGDSRVYMFRDGILKQISVDHTEAQRMVNIGLITQQEAENDPGKYSLTQHLGIFPDDLIVVPHISQPIILNNNDVFLLCSDGLTDVLNNREIQEIIAKSATYSEACKALVNSALEKGGKDNITAVVVEAEL